MAADVRNPSAIHQLELAVGAVHATTSIEPVCHWRQSKAFLPLRLPAAEEHEVCEMAVRCRCLPGGAQSNPLALLLDTSSHTSVLLGRTEWKQRTDSPNFAALICFDIALLSAGVATTLELQLRHVEEPFWDQRDAEEVTALHMMPVLGRVSFRFEEVLGAPQRQLELRLGVGVFADHSGPYPATATLRVRSAVGWPINQLVAQHSCMNYRFICSGDTDGAGCGEELPAHSGCGCGLHHVELRDVSKPAPRELRVCEHMLRCSYGYEVPKAVLTMLLADAELNAAVSTGHAGALGKGRPFSSVSSGGETPAGMSKWDFSPQGLGQIQALRTVRSVPAARPPSVDISTRGNTALTQLNALLSAALTPSAWAAFAAWCRCALEGLDVEAGSERAGFKASTAKKDPRIAAIPVNLQLNLLEVQPDPLPTEAGRRVHNPPRRSDPTSATPGLTAETSGTAQGARRLGPVSAELGAVWPTVTLGAPAAHSLGFKDGGATAVAAKLRTLLTSRELASRRAALELAASFSRRYALLLCHGLSALAACFTLNCRTQVERRSTSFFTQLNQLGFLCHIESLLSTRGDEWGMLQDTEAVVGMLGQVLLMMLPSSEEVPAGVAVRGGVHNLVLCFTPSELGFRDAIHAETFGLVPGTAFHVKPIFFTQGINEEQSMANLMQTHTAEQAAINERALRELQRFHAAFEALAHTSEQLAVPLATSEVLDRQRRLLTKARRLLVEPPDAKNVQLLHVTAALTRLLDGGRITLCKSGKDRSAMSLTLEHALLLQREHGLGEAATANALVTMRRHGVRRENVRQNTSRRVFAFNWMQQKMLPESYRPPEGSAKGAAA